MVEGVQQGPVLVGTILRKPLPGGAKKAKSATRTAKGKVRRTKTRPGRPARPTRPRRARTNTHGRDPGVASSDPKGAVSAST